MNTRDYLVIDLEATCDDAGAVPRGEMEIIEIGAVLVDGTSYGPKAEFQRFVRPLRHPQLTPFCRTLTTITQGEVDGAQTFVRVLAQLREFMAQGSGDPLFCSWGAYDRGQFEQDARFHGVCLPFRGHLNLKAGFSERLGVRKRYGMAGALRRLGLSLEGTHHRGIDDARNIAKILPFVVDGQLLSKPELAPTQERRRGRRRSRSEG